MGKYKIASKESKAQRSKIMAAVKSRNNLSTELKMRKLLRVNKMAGWRRHVDIAGTPDFTWPKKKVALFVDGCFWHKCPYCYRQPKSNVKYWINKIESNKRRDQRINKILRLEDWKVIRVWECKINQRNTIKRIINALYKVKENQGDKILGWNKDKKYE